MSPDHSGIIAEGGVRVHLSGYGVGGQGGIRVHGHEVLFGAMVHHSTVCPGQSYDWTYWRATYRRVFRLRSVVQPFFSTSIGYYVAPDVATSCAVEQDDGWHPIRLTSAVATEAAFGLQVAPLSWLHFVGEAGVELLLADPYGNLFASLSIRLGLPVF